MPIQAQAALHELPPWLNAIYRNIAERAQALSMEPYEEYPHRRIARFPEEIRHAHHIARNAMGFYLPFIDRARELGFEASKDFPSEMQRYMNPYQQAVLDRIRREGVRTFEEGIMPKLQSEFVGLGQHGSSRHADMAQRAARDIQQQIMDRQAESLAQGYGQAAQIQSEDARRKLAAAQEAREQGRYGQAGLLADIGMLEGAGMRKMGREQEVLNQRYNDWLRQRNWPREQLQQFGNLAGGVGQYIPQQGFGFYQQQGLPQPNWLANMGNAAMGLYGAGMLYGGGPFGHKKGGHIKGPKMSKVPNMKLPHVSQMPKMPEKKKKKGLGAMRFDQTSFSKSPKVGGNHSLKRAI